MKSYRSIVIGGHLPWLSPDRELEFNEHPAYHQKKEPEENIAFCHVCPFEECVNCFETHGSTVWKKYARFVELKKTNMSDNKIRIELRLDLSTLKNFLIKYGKEVELYESNK